MWRRFKNTYDAAVQTLDNASRARKAKQKTDNALREGGRTLDLSGMGIRQVPSSVKKMVNLETLNLSTNEINELPDWIFQLKSLRAIDVSHNPLTTLPESIATLPALESITASHCKLGSVPPQIGSLAHLRRLHVDHNNLGSLPVEVLNIPNLNDLNFAHNSPVQTLSAPIWFLNEPINRNWHRFIDLVFILFLAATITVGNLSDGSEKSGHIMLSLITVMNIVLFILPFVMLIRGRQTGRLPMFKNWKALQDVDRGIRWSHIKNWVAAASILAEAVQMCSFAFLQSIPWPEKVGDGVSWTIANFDGHAYVILFWICIGVAIGIRILLELTHFKMIPVQGMVRGIFFLLYIVFSVLYLPVLGQLVAILNCRYEGSNDVPILETTTNTVVDCWRGGHIGYAFVAGVAMLCFHPFGAISAPVWQERAREGVDIRFKPSYIVVVTQIKFVTMVMSRFWSNDDSKLFLFGGGGCLLFLTTYSFLNKPCTSTRAGLWRASGHLCALISFAVSLWVVELDDRDTWTPFIVVVSSWAGIVVLTALATIRVGRIKNKGSYNASDHPLTTRQ